MSSWLKRDVSCGVFSLFQVTFTWFTTKWNYSPWIIRYLRIMFGKLGFLKIWGLVILAWGFCLGKNVCASTAEGLFRKKQSKMVSILTCNFDISYLIFSLAEMSEYTGYKPSLKPHLHYQIELGKVLKIKLFYMGRRGSFLHNSLVGRDYSSRIKMKMWCISNRGIHGLKEWLQGAEGADFKLWCIILQNKYGFFCIVFYFYLLYLIIWNSTFLCLRLDFFSFLKLIQNWIPDVRNDTTILFFLYRSLEAELF